MIGTFDGPYSPAPADHPERFEKMVAQALSVEDSVEASASAQTRHDTALSNTELEVYYLQVGGASSYSTVVEGFRVTAVGEVPTVTLEQIATTMMQR